MVRGQTNVHADEQITKLNMLMHRYTQRQAAEHPASSRTGEGSIARDRANSHREGRQGAQRGAGKQPEVSRQAASERRQAAWNKNPASSGRHRRQGRITIGWVGGKSSAQCEKQYASEHSPWAQQMANSRPLTTDCFWLVNEIAQCINA
jgi:hypothetical protein